MTTNNPYRVRWTLQPDETWLESESGVKPQFDLTDSQLAVFVELALSQLDDQPVIAA